VIKIDNVDTSKIDLQELRNNITFIPQDPVIFDATLKFNLDPTGKISETILKDLVKEAGLDVLLKSESLDLKFTDGGTGMSAGERQLICICRAILRKNKVVVLDEATSNIDVVTEAATQKLIEKSFSDSTVFTIAHRINTIIKSDKVMVLDKGAIVEFDSPERLKEDEKSMFNRLVREMFKE